MQTINENNKLRRTPLYQKHLELGAKMIDFGGWIMPLNYPEGIIAEHLTTRKKAGLFDVSHMGRFTISRKDTLSFLQHVLTNNAAALKVGESQYTIISDEDGIAIDDAYLYRFYQEQYLLVVNASNQDKDKEYLMSMSSSFKDVKINDITNDLSMLSLQGPRSEEILISLISLGALPKPTRNKSSIIKIGDIKVLVARTGYTGEPIGFELFTENKRLADLWTLLCTRGSSPVGLGARDTLRLEAGLPLYGNELGVDAQGNKIPIFAPSQSRLAVSFSPFKKGFIGKDALKIQFEARKKILNKDFSMIRDLPKMVMQLELLEKSIARSRAKIYFNNQEIGYITSGTIVPYWIFRNIDNKKEITKNSSTRAVTLALIDSRRCEQDIVEVKIRNKNIKAIIMPYLLKTKAFPYAFPVTSKGTLNKGG